MKNFKGECMKSLPIKDHLANRLIELKTEIKTLKKQKHRLREEIKQIKIILDEMQNDEKLA